MNPMRIKASGRLPSGTPGCAEMTGARNSWNQLPFTPPGNIPRASPIATITTRTTSGFTTVHGDLWCSAPCSPCASS